MEDIQYLHKRDQEAVRKRIHARNGNLDNIFTERELKAIEEAKNRKNIAASKSIKARPLTKKQKLLSDNNIPIEYIDHYKYQGRSDIITITIPNLTEKQFIRIAKEFFTKERLTFVEPPEEKPEKKGKKEKSLPLEYGCDKAINVNGAQYNFTGDKSHEVISKFSEATDYDNEIVKKFLAGKKK